MTKKQKTLIIVAAAAALVCCVLPVGAVVVAALRSPSRPTNTAAPVATQQRPTPTTTSQPPPATSSTTTAAAVPPAGDFNRAEFDTYWASGSVPPSVLGLVETVDWDGVSLTAHTRIVFDADAKTPAVKVCSALSAYWLTAGKDFHPVRVMDTADQILVSRRSLGDTCTWRR